MIRKHVNPSAKIYEPQKSNYSFYKKKYFKRFCQPGIEYILESGIYLVTRKFATAFEVSVVKMFLDKVSCETFTGCQNCTNNSFI